MSGEESFEVRLLRAMDKENRTSTFAPLLVAALILTVVVLLHVSERGTVALQKMKAKCTTPWDWKISRD